MGVDWLVVITKRVGGSGLACRHHKEGRWEWTGMS